MIWATISTLACFCWLCRASPCLAAKKKYNQSDFGIDHLAKPTCRVFSCVVGRGCLLWPVCSLGKTLLTFANMSLDVAKCPLGERLLPSFLRTTGSRTSCECRDYSEGIFQKFLISIFVPQAPTHQLWHHCHHFHPRLLHRGQHAASNSVPFSL